MVHFIMPCSHERNVLTPSRVLFWNLLPERNLPGG
jgi:hypothetical protein